MGGSNSCQGLTILYLHSHYQSNNHSITAGDAR